MVEGPAKANGIEVDPPTKAPIVEDKSLPWKVRTMNRLKNQIQSARYFIYNKEEQTILGNTSTSWLKIAIYYCVFYICLALFYSGMVAVFGAIISREHPRYSYPNSEMNIDGQLHIGELERHSLAFSRLKLSLSSHRNGLSTDARHSGHEHFRLQRFSIPTRCDIIVENLQKQ